ncbi:hypothetical protein N0O92_04965 [Alkalihalobacillus sp. MEB130]|uniref:hypothetical protein n=1 Tax=Alkalihalobacillus sp. MEB130 TaxID=2976704 RepID=UPI0028DE6EA9|nr:hypothetical protein [Alkalihalobacillus sp. MEB130]MDT8859576.1 hypothetical protein [Alkalihalobacillus sp. MEB130]
MVTHNLERITELFPLKPVAFSMDLTGVSTADMMQTETLNQMIQNRTDCFNGSDLRLGGANLMKWFGNLLTAHLYIFTVHNRWLEYEELRFIEEGKEAHFQLLQPYLIELPVDDRETIGKEKLSQLFSEFQPLFVKIAESSGLSIQQIWGLVTNPYYSRLPSWTDEVENEQLVELGTELVKNLHSDLFGLKRNPFNLTFRYIESWKDANVKIRVKGACCMSFLKGEGNYCYSCPKLTKEARLDRGKQLREINGC